MHTSAHTHARTHAHTETPATAIEDAFREFTNRDDVAIVLITQPVAHEIRYLLDGYTKARAHVSST